MDDRDITQLQLDVYMTREGPWYPDQGDLEIPEDWDFLPESQLTTQAARVLYGTEAPRPKERERARRKLEAAVGRDRPTGNPATRRTTRTDISELI